MENEKDETAINYYIDPSCVINGMERMEIGSNVVVQRDCWMNIAYNNPNNSFMIQIGNGCNLERRCCISAANSIELGENVLLSPNVLITDHEAEPENMVVPIIKQGNSTVQNRIIIGDGTWIGNNSVITGNIQIGKGCVISANTVITCDIPDYCVVSGFPPRVTEILDVDSKEWIKVETEEQSRALLDKRKKTLPLVSICIPTYNRARDLEICLNSIVKQIGCDGGFQIIVSDNASTDDTQNVANRFKAIYPNLKYYKNKSNIGGDRNILESIKLAEGEYVFLHGDDDFYKEGTLPVIYNIINQNRHISLFFLNVLGGSGQVRFSGGLDNYLKDTSIYAGFISSVIFKKSEFDRVENCDRFVDMNFNQIYLQYSILWRTNDYCIIDFDALWHANNGPSGYSFAKVFIKNYIDILMYLTSKGLSHDAITADKQKILGCMIYPWYKRILAYRLPLDLNDFDEIFTAYYKDEPYFQEACSMIESIRMGRS